MPHPSDVKGVQRFVGFVTYLAKFLPRLSEVCEPLRRLMDKDTIWHWLPKHDAAVREIKQLVTQTPVLRYYNVSKPVTIQSDSSQYGLGCCLMQEGQPVAFASRALTPTEQNYAQIEEECLSIVFACQRFHHYLYGRDNITAETDHKPLIAIFSKPLLNAPKRLQSMLLALQNYNLKVVYKPGPEMYVSDTLSRATASGTHTRSMHEQHAVCSLQTEQVDVEHINQADYLNVTDQRLIQIRQHTDRDGQLQALRSVILMGWPDCREETALAVREYWPIKEELSVQNGVIFKSQRVVIPRSLRPEMLARVHSSHIGGEACYSQARDTLYWPGMQSEIKDYVSKCTICNEYAIEQQRETMMSHELPMRPWQIVSLDLFQHSGKDFLLVVDHYSDFWEIDLPDFSAETTIKRCKAQFARYGQPDRVISDNGPQFSGVEF
uniref:Gypsy retrotransposon integrase-like protein 1 n=1 Tax=Oncorhynchus kisutch TaxID=8019 RepID=A0A8C7DZQ6_ONCKI